MISQLVDRATQVAKVVGSILAWLEVGEAKHGTGDVDQAVYRAVSEYLASKDELIPNSLEPTRAARVVANAWLLRSGRSGRHPDVLSLTCQLMANPALSYSLNVVRFSVVLMLRSLYRITYSAESISHLRAAHSQLQRRFKDQERRRSRKKASRYEEFLLDLACLEGSVYRSLSKENLSFYFSAFDKYPLGISGERRMFSATQAWPELHGELPDFSALVKLAFSQPTCVAGLDDVLQGLVASVSADESANSDGGLVTLIAGPPGSGKTSLCLTLASRMAELGSFVSYIATEEEPHALRAKLAAVANTEHLATALLGDDYEGDASSHHRLGFVDGRELQKLSEVVDALAAHATQAMGVLPVQPSDGLFLVFPRVLVIDSLAVLVSGSLNGRQLLGQLLTKLRSIGMCVFLVGGPQDCQDQGLAYLVDNVFELDVGVLMGSSHAVRGITIHKTRLQTSYRGRHILHLSRHDGCTVSPSLHSITRSLHSGSGIGPDSEYRAVLWASGRQLQLPGIAQIDDLISVQKNSQTLVYGFGSTGKARFAMAFAFEPRLRSSRIARVRASHPDYSGFYHDDDKRSLAETRVLVVSFLYDRDYYRAIAKQILALRFRSEALVGEHLEVIDLYPGFLDPESLVARIRRILERGRLEGKPFSAVIVDGIHNLLMQFPLLEREPLLWPTLYRVLREERVDAISTFTFFRLVGMDETLDSPPSRLPKPETVGVSQELFFHLLVGNCDYSILMAPPPRTVDPGLVQMRVVSSLEKYDPRTTVFFWSPDRLSYVPGWPTEGK